MIGGYDYPNGSGKVSNSMVQHNTIVDNNVQGNGGEMIVNYTKNCILNGNLIYNIQHSELFFNDAGSMNLACDYNCYYAGVTADFSLNGISYSGISAWRAASNGDDNSMELDPLLVNVSLLNFQITAQSPCIDTGDVAFIASPSETDIDTCSRLQNGRVDIGADEYGTAVGVYVLQGQSSSFVVTMDYSSVQLSWKNPLIEQEQILLTDIQGKQISITSVNPGEQSTSISIQGLAAGTYYLVLKTSSVAVPIVISKYPET